MDLKKTAKTGKVAFLEANKIIKEKRNDQHHTPISYNSDGLQISCQSTFLKSKPKVPYLIAKKNFCSLLWVWDM